MHIAEGFLPPAHAIGWTIAANTPGSSPPPRRRVSR